MSQPNLQALQFGSLIAERNAYRRTLAAFDSYVFRYRIGQREIPFVGKTIHQWLTFLRSLPTDSANGVIALAKLKESQQEVILKTSNAKKTSDPISYEFVVQAVLNKLKAQVPHFSFVYALFRCNSVIAPDRNFLGSIRRYTIKEFCTHPPAQGHDFIMIEHIKRGVSLRSKFQSLRGEHAAAIYLSHLAQVLFALQIAQDTFQFTHYDLHSDNVLAQDLKDCCGSHQPKSLPVYVYKYRGKEYVFAARWNAVIIDFGRSHIALSARKRIGKQYKLPASTYDPRGYFKLWHGQYGIDISRFNPVYDLVRYVNSTYDSAPAVIRNHPKVKQIRNIMASEFPDYQSTGKFTRLFRGKNNIVKEPFDVIKLILRTGLTQTLAKETLKEQLKLKKPFLFYWNYSDRRSFNPEKVKLFQLTGLIGFLLQKLRRPIAYAEKLIETSVPPLKKRLFQPEVAHKLRRFARLPNMFHEHV